MRNLPTGTITLLFTDIEGSTQLLQQLGADYAEVLMQCRRLLRVAFQMYLGHEVDTQGDAFFISFTRASDAIGAAVTAQRSVAAHPWPHGVEVRVRMGLHTGEPQLSAEGYVGMDVHHTARIMSSAHGGQVLLSQTTRDLVEHDLPEGVSLRDMGEYRLMPGKMTAYETDIHVPLVVTGPGVPSGRIIEEIVENVDLCPTFAELAGAAAPGAVSGHSLVPLLHGKDVVEWRTGALVEHRGPQTTTIDPDLPAPRTGRVTTIRTCVTCVPCGVAGFSPRPHRVGAAGREGGRRTKDGG